MPAMLVMLNLLVVPRTDAGNAGSSGDVCLIVPAMMVMLNMLAVLPRADGQFWQCLPLIVPAMMVMLNMLAVLARTDAGNAGDSGDVCFS